MGAALGRWWRRKRAASNPHEDEIVVGLRELLSDRLQWVVLYHLSRTNNMPVLAEQAVAQVLDLGPARTEICVAEQSRPTPWLQMTG